jgi:hypothetical protein
VTRRLALAVCFCLALVAAVPYDGVGGAAYMRKYADFVNAGHDGCPAYFDHLAGQSAGNCCNLISRCVKEGGT